MMKEGKIRYSYTRMLYVSGEDIQIMDKAIELARTEGLSLNKLIIKALEEYIKRHGQGNPSFPLDKWVENIEFKAFPTLGDKPNPRLLNTLDNDMLEEYAQNAWLHLEAAKTEIATRRAKGTWDRPYWW